MSYSDILNKKNIKITCLEHLNHISMSSGGPLFIPEILTCVSQYLSGISNDFDFRPLEDKRKVVSLLCIADTNMDKVCLPSMIGFAKVMLRGISFLKGHASLLTVNIKHGTTTGIPIDLGIQLPTLLLEMIRELQNSLHPGDDGLLWKSTVHDCFEISPYSSTVLSAKYPKTFAVIDLLNSKLASTNGQTILNYIHEELKALIPNYMAKMFLERIYSFSPNAHRKHSKIQIDTFRFGELFYTQVRCALSHADELGSRNSVGFGAFWTETTPRYENCSSNWLCYGKELNWPLQYLKSLLDSSFQIAIRAENGTLTGSEKAVLATQFDYPDFSRI